MGVEREDRDRQRQHRRVRGFARGRLGIAPRASRHRRAGQPQQQPDNPGFAEDFQHDLMRVEGRAFAPGSNHAGLRVAGREGFAETARADAVDRMLRGHTPRRAPDAAAARQCAVHADVIAAEHVQRAFNPLLHLRRHEGQRDQQHSAERKHAQQPLPAEQMPAGQQQHQTEGDPGRARTREQDHAADRQRGQQPAPLAEPAAGGVHRERRQTGQHQTELQIAGPQRAAETIQQRVIVGVAQAMAADREFRRVHGEKPRTGAANRLHDGVERPHADDRGHANEGDPSPARIGHRRRRQPQERQITQIDRGFAKRAGTVHRIDGADQLRQPVGEEQHAGQRPGLRAEQGAAATESHENQTANRRQRT